MKYFAILLLTAMLFLSLVSCSEKSTTQALPQCAKPSFSLTGGVYTEVDTFTISCVTPEARIHYTIDETEPDENSSIFHDELTFTQTRVFKAKAFKDGYEPSETAIVRYILNKTSFDFATIPAGTFTMGRTKGDGQSDELPTHQVTLSSFKISKSEITQYNWLSITGASLSQDTGWQKLPAYNMNWYGAIKFCNLRSIADTLTPVYTIMGKTNPDEWGPVPTYFNPDWDAVICNWDANGYRLPTEAEWEYAARGAVNTPDYLFAGSDSLEEVGVYTENSGGTVDSVGSKAPNVLGINDMSGNVWEWCWDIRDSLYYATSPVNNPKGPNTGIQRVLRGGCFDSEKINCRVAERNYSVPYYKSDVIGIRLVRKN